MDEFEGLTDWEIGRRRQQLIQQLGRLQTELDKRRAQNRHVMKQAEQQWSDRSQMGMRESYRRTHLVSPELGFNCYNLSAFIIELPAGTSDGAYHRHGEAVKYYISGKGIEMIDGNTYEVEAGDTSFIPAQAWHGTQNPGPEPLRFFAVTDQYNALQKPSPFRIRDDMRTPE